MKSTNINSEVNEVMDKAWQAYEKYRQLPLSGRASFMKRIAGLLEEAGDDLLQTAAEETNLPLPRLRNERKRTAFQLTSYADACLRGDWLEASIDTSKNDNGQWNNGIRKMRIPLGPVVVFGASNFPFAYSTAGGDTASALAAGCPVIVKAHPAHPETSNRVAQLIMQAAKECDMPEGIFSHVHGGHDTGKQLVQHAHTKAVGFTGSFSGGMALYQWANERKDPIPVFSEMGSVNPIFILPKKMQTEAAALAETIAESVTLGVGQFCTNPGILVAMNSEGLEIFTDKLVETISAAAPGTMLHHGIYESYREKRQKAVAENNVEVLAVSDLPGEEQQALPTISTTTAANFISNKLLHQEVFGPYSILVICRDKNEMMEVCKSMEGQLTASIMAAKEEVEEHLNLLNAITEIGGRIIMNGVPTGVEVCQSMHHGGPFPATTDARFTAVGADAIKRFSRPLCYQNWDNEFLPPALKNENPLGIYRTVNNVLTRDPL